MRTIPNWEKIRSFHKNNKNFRIRMSSFYMRLFFFLEEVILYFFINIIEVFEFK